MVEVAGVDKSALYKINADSTVETLWTSKDENIYDLVAHSNGELYFATNAQGRIYRLNADRKPAQEVGSRFAGRCGGFDVRGLVFGDDFGAHHGGATRVSYGARNAGLPYLGRTLNGKTTPEKKKAGASVRKGR